MDKRRKDAGLIKTLTCQFCSEPVDTSHDVYGTCDCLTVHYFHQICYNNTINTKLKSVKRIIKGRTGYASDVNMLRCNRCNRLIVNINKIPKNELLQDTNTTRRNLRKLAIDKDLKSRERSNRHHTHPADCCFTRFFCWYAPCLYASTSASFIKGSITCLLWYTFALATALGLEQFTKWYILNLNDATYMVMKSPIPITLESNFTLWDLAFATPFFVMVCFVSGAIATVYQACTMIRPEEVTRKIRIGDRVQMSESEETSGDLDYGPSLRTVKVADKRRKKNKYKPEEYDGDNDDDDEEMIDLSTNPGWLDGASSSSTTRSFSRTNSESVSSLEVLSSDGGVYVDVSLSARSNESDEDSGIADTREGDGNGIRLGRRKSRHSGESKRNHNGNKKVNDDTSVIKEVRPSRSVSLSKYTLGTTTQGATTTAKLRRFGVASPRDLARKIKSISEDSVSTVSGDGDGDANTNASENVNAHTKSKRRGLTRSKSVPSPVKSSSFVITNTQF